MKKAATTTLLFLLFQIGFSQTWFDIGLKGGIGTSFMYNAQIFDDQAIVHKFKPGYTFGGKLGFNFIQEHQITFDIMKTTYQQGFTYKPEGWTGSSDAERTKVPGVEEFFVDLGMTPAEVKKRVKVGDFVVLDQPFLETPLKVVSKALDNRMACFVAIEALRRIASRGQKHAADIVVAFCTQEEVGLRGATTAANQVGADIGVGLDVNLACDTPGVPDNQRVTKQGDGAAIMVQDSSMISDYRLVDELCAVARKHRIPCQRAVLPRGGQDGAAIQRSGKGARCVALGAGTRYIHTTTEMIDRRDLDAVVDLLAAWLVTVE